MNAEEILTEVYWNLSTLDGGQIKYPDHDTLIKQLKKYMNSRYGIIIAKEGKMAGFLNAQVQEWYKNNTDLLGVIEKLTNRCKKLEEENECLKDDNKILKDEFDIKVKVVKELNDYTCKINKRCGELEEENQHLKDEVKAAVSREVVTKKNLEYRTHEVADLNNCLAKKNARIKELKQKLTAITNVNALDFNAIFTSLGVNDTRSALDKIMEMKKTIKQNEDDLYLIDQNRKADAKNYENIQIAYDNLVDRYEELQASYDNCVNECSDHVIEIDSLLKNLEVKTVKQGIEMIRALKAGHIDVKYEYSILTSTEQNLRVENENLKKKVEDLRKDVKFEFDHRMKVLAASTDQAVKMELLKQENDRLKNFIKDRTKDIREMSEEIEKHLAKYREEKDHD